MIGLTYFFLTWYWVRVSYFHIVHNNLLFYSSNGFNLLNSRKICILILFHHLCPWNVHFYQLFSLTKCLIYLYFLLVCLSVYWLIVNRLDVCSLYSKWVLVWNDNLSGHMDLFYANKTNFIRVMLISMECSRSEIWSICYFSIAKLIWPTSSLAQQTFHTNQVPNNLYMGFVHCTHIDYRVLQLICKESAKNQI